MAKNPPFLGRKLNERRELGNLRSLPSGAGLVDFVSNDYLGLAQSTELKAIIQDGVTTQAGNGSTGSRLLSGNSPAAMELESKLATLFKAERSLLFNSGYQANLAVLSSLPQRGDTVFYDELSHASIKDGIRLSHANRFPFKHNDLQDLQRKLIKAEGQKWIVVESIYSMDGDEGLLAELAVIAKQHEAMLIVDEAHSTGVVGTGGNGLLCAKELEDEVVVRIYTFGKAMGVHGAAVCGSTELIDYLINFARPFIYSTAMPDHSLLAIGSAFDYLKNHMELQNRLQSRISLFNSLIQQEETKDKLRHVVSNSPIQVILLRGNDYAKNVASRLQHQGFDVRAILSPTVREGSERIRITLHTYNSDEEIENLVNRLTELL